MAELSERSRPLWLELEEDSAGRCGDAAHWVGVYTNLVTLLAKGAAVSVGDRQGNDLVRIGLTEVQERLDFWQSRLERESVAGRS